METEAPASEIRTFLIADVRGYTRFTLERGDAAAARLAARFADVTREVMGERGGHVLELRGDEALVVFSSTRQALWAAVELQERLTTEAAADPSLPLAAGVGVDAGEAVPLEGGYRGAALNLAARLCSIARPGEVLVTEGVIHLARKTEGLEYGLGKLVELKGFAEPVRAIEVTRAESGNGGTFTPVAEPMRPPDQQLPTGGFLGALPSGPLVARDAEMQQLLGLVTESARGEGRTVLLSGEPGAGKTRLAQEVTVALREHGFLIAAGRCYEPEQSVPYYPYLDAFSVVYGDAPPAVQREAMRRWPYLGVLLPDQLGFPELVEGQDDQQRVFRAITSFLETVAESRPIALLLDDLHWADTASLKLLLHLARHTRDAPVFILGTYRDVELGRQHPLEGALRDLGREGLVERLDIRRLPPEGTAALVSATMGGTDISDEFADLVHRRTEGNPYFVQQVLRVLVDRGDLFEQNGRWQRRSLDEIEVPESVRSVVGNRLSRLDAETQEVLHAASVFGGTFSFDDLLAMVDRSEEELDAALEVAGAAGLTRTTDGEVYAFDHTLTQQTLYHELSPRRRRRLHAAAGKAIEALPERKRETRVAELAWHFLQADDVEKALKYSMEAGDRAETVFAHADAEAQYRIALELARESGNAEREAEASQELGQALLLSGRYAEAMEPLEDAVRLFRALGDLERELGAVSLIGEIHSQQGTSEEGIKRVLPAVEEMEAEGAETLSPACSAGLYVSLAALYFRGGHWHDLLRVTGEAVRLADEAGKDILLAKAEYEHGRALSLAGMEEEARWASARSAELAAAVNDFTTLRTALNNLAYIQRRAGDLRGAVESYCKALDVAERVGDPSVIAFARFVLGRAYVEGGAWAEARIQFEQALEAAQSSGASWYSSYALAGLGYLNVMEGERDTGLQYLRDAVAAAERNGDVQGLVIHRYLARQEILDGQANAAVERLERVRELTDRAGRAIYLTELPWAHLEAGNIERAAELLDTMDERKLFEGRLEIPDVLWTRALLAARQGRGEDALRLLDEGLALAREIGLPFDEGMLLLEYGRLLDAGGKPVEARERFDGALAIFERLGARPYVEMVQREPAEKASVVGVEPSAGSP